MTPVEAVGFLPALTPVGESPAASAAPGFAQWMAREIAATNDKALEAERLVQRLASGDTSNLHQVMIGIEQARLQFQLLMSVRSRVIEAYQDILRMQV